MKKEKCPFCDEFNPVYYKEGEVIKKMTCPVCKKNKVKNDKNLQSNK